MIVSYRWLKEIAPTIADSATELAERLTYTSVPVDEVVWLGEGLTELVVGRVESITKHPKADRLVICQVDVGRGQPAQVVTGAPVVVEGGFYPFVGAGQTLPGGQAIKRVKLRGEPSEGMLCSERELGIGRDASGIMQLSGDFTPGQALLEALPLDDHRLDVDVTANRPDLLGHWGVAREVAPAGEADLRLADFPGRQAAEYEVETAGTEGETDGVTVRIEDAQGCPRYMGAVVRGVKVGPSPEWLASRLRAVGQQPINNVVDATNYVLQELNQPLHAFDLAKLGGATVIIRRALAGEKLTTLDGKDRELDPEMLVIADAKVPTALAGIMGGEGSEVSEATRDLFIECAYFEPQRVRRAARALGLDTDASYRFQRGIDPCGLPTALARVVELILTVAGGTAASPAVDVNPLPAGRRTVRLRARRVAQLLGVAVAPATIRSCLEPIGFELGTAKQDDSLTIAIPTWRPDVEREVDIIEEVARRHGYDKFPDEMRNFRPTTVPEDIHFESLRRVREAMVGLGFMEARTTPFAADEHGEVRLQNPLSEREDHLRRDLLTGLVRRIEYNFARGERDVRLFEIGNVFLDSGGPTPVERMRVAAAWTGRREPAHWTGEGEDYDFWDLKWLVAMLADAATDGGAAARPLDPPDADVGFADPLAVVTPSGTTLGWGGRLRAGDIEAPRWAGDVWGVEIEIVPSRAEPTHYQTLPNYPAVERDLALIVARHVLAAEVGAVIREAAPDTLEELTVFDVYEGEQIPAGTRSIAWRLRFRSLDRTLTDKEVDASVEAITSALERKLNVGVRGA